MMKMKVINNVLHIPFGAYQGGIPSISEIKGYMKVHNVEEVILETPQHELNLFKESGRRLPSKWYNLKKKFNVNIVETVEEFERKYQ